MAGLVPKIITLSKSQVVAQHSFVWSLLNRKSAKGKMIAWMHLPTEVTVDMFDSRQKLMLYPGGVEALRQRVFRPRGPGCKVRGITILAFFDKGEVLDAVDDNGKVDIDIVGKLKSGQFIYGTDNIRITQPRRRRRYGWCRR